VSDHPTNAALRLRRAGPDDDAGIRGVIAAAFDDNPKTDIALTAWQYWDNPFGESCAWVWEDGDQIVACYVAFPLPVLLEGRMALGSSGVDAALHPEYQGRRLFRPLAEALYADCGTHGMEITLCFATNPAALKGIASAGWIAVDELRLWVMALDDAWLAQRFRVPSPLAAAARWAVFDPRPGPAAGEAAQTPNGVDTLWETTAATIRNGVARNEMWWRWRYDARPGGAYRFFEDRRQGRLVGAAVTTIREAFGGRFAYVLELMAEDDRSARAVGRAVASAARRDGAAGLALLALPGDRVEHWVRQAGFRRLPRRMVPRPTWYGAVRNSAGAPDPAHTSWSFRWGDLDHL
jgi:hypothetical protein